MRAHLRRWLRPPRILRPTRAGWCYFGITFCVGFAALNTGNNLLYLVLSLMLAFLILSGVLSESALRGIRVRRVLPSELCAGAEASVGIEIQNAQRGVPAFAVVVEDCLDAGPGRSLERAARAGSVFALRIAPGDTAHRRYGLCPERRGALKFSGIRVLTRFPFGLFLKYRVIELPAEALVYPALGRAGARGVHAERSDGEERSGARKRDGAEVGGLRNHDDGDSLRRVHWKSSLRRGMLLVREVEDASRSQVEVHLRTSSMAAGEAFERHVSKAASLVSEHLDAGRSVGLRTDRESLAPGTGARQRRLLLGFLACVGPDAAAGEASARAGAAARRAAA